MHSDAVLILILTISKGGKKYYSRVSCNTQYFPEYNHCSSREKKVYSNKKTSIINNLSQRVH